MIAPEIKKILKELLAHKKSLIIVAVAGVIMSIAQARVAMMVKDLMDNMQSTDVSSLRMVAVTILGLYFILGVARYFHFFTMNYTMELVTQSLRQKLQEKFMNLNVSFHNNYSTGAGGLISRILNDIFVIQNGLRMFADFFREPILLILLIGWLFHLHWQLTSFIIFVLPGILWFLKRISKTIKTHSIKGQQDLEIITSTIKESLDGVRIIQSFNLEEEMRKRFSKEFEAYLYSRKKIHQRVELASPVTEFIAAAIMISIIFYISMEIANGRATIGDFGSYLASVLMLSAPIKKLQESYVRIQETSVAAQRVYSLLEEKSEVPQSTQNKEFPANWKSIQFKNVSFSYGSAPILKNINLTIKRGEMVAFVGASGSGKSTLVNLLERFFDPTSGQILIDETPIDTINLKSLRANIALVTQDVFLFSDTIEKNIWAGDFSKPKEKVIDAAKAANAHNFISQTPLGYQNRVGDRGSLLSGGEKQRVSIARAIFKDAPLLILDEATSALDTASEVEVQKGLDHLMSGRTALVIAHRLSTIAKADKIVVMKAGEIVEIGTHQQLIDAIGEYHKLHQLQHS